jgi:thiosulfate/3-mercaptopyruvate sulfurtransferase
MFKTMGHENVAVLNGGLPTWIKKGFTTETKTPKAYAKGDFKATIQPSNIKDFPTIKTNIEKQNFTVLDARSEGRFKGTSPEPRKGLRSGKIPNSYNLPYEQVLENGKYKPIKELEIIFSELSVNKKPITFSCGSGLTACIILLAYTLISDKGTAVYDGSWTEWAQREPEY